MPSRTYWPTSEDLNNFLSAAGLTVSTSLELFLDTAVSAARRDFEGPAGADRKMLGDTSDVARRYDPPTDGQSLLFIADLASLTSVVYQPDGSSAETLTQNTDFWLEPYEAQSDSNRPAPYTRIRFARRWLQPLGTTLRRSIIITGKWGYATTLPDDVWLACLARAGWHLHATLAQSTSGGLVRWSDADASEQFGDSPLQALKDGWDGMFRTVAHSYRRLSL